MAYGRRQSICYVVPGADLVPGSASTRRTLSLARALAEHADVTVAFRHIHSPVAAEPFDVVAIEPGASGGAPSLRALGRFVEDRCAAFGSVLEGGWSFSGKVTAWCARRGIPAVPIVERHPAAGWLAPLTGGRTWLGLGSSGRYLRRTPVVIAGSEDIKAAIVQRWRVDPARIVVVPAGLDRGRLAPRDQADARTRLGLPPEARILLAGGALDRSRDLGPLIEAVQRVGDAGLRLHVLGRGECHADLERLAGPGGPVTFYEPTGDDQVGELLAAADLCVAVEHAEGPLADPMGWAACTVAECLAAGRPVAVGMDGERRHPLVHHRVSGFLVEHDLLAWIRFLQRDCPPRNSLHDMGQAAAATRVVEVGQVAAAYLAVLDRASGAMGRVIPLR